MGLAKFRVKTQLHWYTPALPILSDTNVKAFKFSGGPQVLLNSSNVVIIFGFAATSGQCQ